MDVRRFLTGPLTAMREAARAALLCDLPRLVEKEAWEEVDPHPFVAAFPPLTVRPGFRLAAFRRSLDDGLLAALPAAAVVAPPQECLVQGELRIPGALADFMGAIVGDGTPWSFLVASVFARTASEFGCADGHRLDFAHHQLIDAAPELSPSGVPWLRCARWHEDFRPEVVVDRRVLVSFHGVTEAGLERLVRFTDLYRPDALQAVQREATTIALGANGWRV